MGETRLEVHCRTIETDQLKTGVQPNLTTEIVIHYVKCQFRQKTKLLNSSNQVLCVVHRTHSSANEEKLLAWPDAITKHNSQSHNRHSRYFCSFADVTGLR